MKKLLLLAAAAALLSPALPAQDAASTAQQLAGKWRIASGRNPGSQTNNYGGTVQIAAKSNGVMGMIWNVNGTPAYAGIGLTNGRLMAAGYGNNAPFGLIVYEAKGDEFQGIWTGSMTKGEVGFETLRPSGTQGVFDIVKGTQPGGGNYSGQVRIEKKGDVYEMQWRIGKEVYRGAGIRVGDTLIAGWTPGKSVGVVFYKLGEGLKTMEGLWTGLGATKLGSETLER
ncbi:MAG: hypothetical protein JSR82_09445 [Verrucomicrobia bacterium]|nr:hypothetical protein [Verrucomicrobiota bacterium]